MSSKAHQSFETELSEKLKTRGCVPLSTICACCCVRQILQRREKMRASCKKSVPLGFLLVRKLSKTGEQRKRFGWLFSRSSAFDSWTNGNDELSNPFLEKFEMSPGSLRRTPCFRLSHRWSLRPSSLISVPLLNEHLSEVEEGKQSTTHTSFLTTTRACLFRKRPEFGKQISERRWP